MLPLQTTTSDIYRTDIDGLRAIAVLAVIIFHIHNSLLPGGFVGVDIFFVISGYLITLHIIRDLDSDNFSLLEFYRRRIKRIVPVMLVIVVFVIVISLIIQRPEDSKNVAKTSVAALLSVSNIYFWLFQDSGYFAQASREIPLLHLWSLGVEEQFYIFWPLVLMAFYKALRGRHFIGLFTVVMVFSFLAGQFLYSQYPSFVYYMLPTRAGELLVGALAAYMVAKRPIIDVSDTIIHLSSISGLLLIIFSLVFLSETDVFPGINAFPPTAGTALLILSGHYGNSRLKRLLTLQPLVFIGLISYSAYLWHWPLLAFTHYSGVQIGIWEGIIIFAATIALSIFTFYFVERPTRQYEGGAIKVIAYQYLIPCSVILIFSILIYKTNGYFMHNNAEQYKLAKNKLLPAYEYDYVCQQSEITDEDINNPSCILGKKTDADNLKPSVLLWGDSNAAHYIGIIGTFSLRADFTFQNLQHSSCPPLLSDPTDFIPAKLVENCAKSLRRIKPVIDSYEKIIISSDYVYYQSGSERFLPEFLKTVEHLIAKDKQIILLGKVPHIDGYDRTCNEKAISIPFIDCRYENNSLSEEIYQINNKLRNFANNNSGVEYYDIVNHLCKDGMCSAYNSNGDPLYYDFSHLSMPSSWKIGNDIVEKGGVPFPFTLLSNQDRKS
ncbi:MAG: acyltransferase [Gammaproteobacteria bacterium]|nr:MAG: acyltransferase [Gammaproteobacteria bacterium]